jgi:hypothetical protein
MIIKFHHSILPFLYYVNINFVTLIFNLVPVNTNSLEDIS